MLEFSLLLLGTIPEDSAILESRISMDAPTIALGFLGALMPGAYSKSANCQVLGVTVPTFDLVVIPLRRLGYIRS